MSGRINLDGVLNAGPRRQLPAVLRAQGRVLLAVMLRDIKTRFTSGYFGLFLSIAWPMTHSFALLAINAGLGRAVPYGESGALWFGTGLVPFMAFSYLARFTMIGVVLNRNLLTFPVVKIVDVLFARAIVEVLCSSFVIIATLVIYASIGVDWMPYDVPQAFYAIGASLLLGLGFGVLNGAIAAALPFWMTAYALFGIVMWIASGVMFVPDSLPEPARYFLSFNPALQGVEWVRSAYYDGYGSNVLDKTYMVEFGVVCLFLGLALERLIRGKILA